MSHMTPLSVPDGGLTLQEPSPSSNTKCEATGPTDEPAQILQLNIDNETLKELLRVGHNNTKSVNICFGKAISLHYGNKSQPFCATPSSSHTSLYSLSTDNETQLQFAGTVSHNLAMQKARDDIAGADEALSKLQAQLASHKEAKQSNQITYVPDGTSLPPPVKQTVAAFKQHTKKNNSLSFLKKHPNTSHLNHSTTRSMPVSPSIGAVHRPLSQKPTPTSTPNLPNGRMQRLQAIRTPLIHFLAARPASTKLLSKNLVAKEDDILELLQKVGKPFRLDNNKWDLTDKTFKELDVWEFEYSNQEERELAIGRAISAFDRMRLSTQEKLWDMLLPKKERGKGKVLSHLNLHKGPIQQTAAPKIQVQHPSNNSNVDEGLFGDESDQKNRLAPSDAKPMVRSSSQGPIKKTKVSEKEAQSKRLLSNGPKKITSATKEKEAHSAAKKGLKKKETPKSSEFVHDSDEEDGLEDAATLQARSSASKKIKSKPDPKPLKASNATQPATADPFRNMSTKTSKAPKQSHLTTSVSTVDSNTSKPSTPSQPGSSSEKQLTEPSPANAKDGQGDGKFSKIPAKAPVKKDTSSRSPALDNRLSETSHGGTVMKKSLSGRQRNTSSPHKPSPLGSSPPANASDFDNLAPSPKASTTMLGKSTSTPNGLGLQTNGDVRITSEHTRKRKADDLDSDMRSRDSPLGKGHIEGRVNGAEHSTKRQNTSQITPPSSDSSGSPLGRDIALHKAQDFKKYYAIYEALYSKVANTDNPPKEMIDELMKKHERLAELKDLIRKGLASV